MRLDPAHREPGLPGEAGEAAHDVGVVDEVALGQGHRGLQRVAVEEGHRVGRVVAVEDGEPAAGSEHSKGFGEGAFGIGQMGEDGVRDDGVEGGVGLAGGDGVGDLEGHAGPSAVGPLRPVDQAGRGVDPDEARRLEMLEQEASAGPVAAADLQQLAAASFQRTEIAGGDPLHRGLGRALVHRPGDLLQNVVGLLGDAQIEVGHRHYPEFAAL